MNPERRGVDVFVDDLDKAPWCAHDEKESDSKRQLRMSIYRSAREEEPPRAVLSSQLKRILSADGNRGFCKTCCALVTSAARREHHGHDLMFNLTSDQLHRPTLLLPALEDSKSYAQYLFSDSSVEFLVKRLYRLGLRHLLCLGAPRIHEQVIFARASGQGKISTMTSFLLDFDRRFAHFFPVEEYQHFNMFNRHFFDGNAGREHLLAFLQSSVRGQLALILDPPFGGLGEPIAACVRLLWKLASEHSKNSADSENKTETSDGVLQSQCSPEEIATVWVFPYFLELQVTAALPSLAMLEYKVDYDNHPLYTNKAKKASSRMSPVRLFTNILPNQFALPTDEGYRFCKLCNRYVAPENRHCVKCNACTSKDGRPHQHCDQCGICVKQGRVHCTVCDSCLPEGHQCRTADVKDGKVSTGCHVCGKEGHKRRNCPLRAKPVAPPAKRRKRA